MEGKPTFNAFTPEAASAPVRCPIRLHLLRHLTLVSWRHIFLLNLLVQTLPSTINAHQSTLDGSRSAVEFPSWPASRICCHPQEATVFSPA